MKVFVTAMTCEAEAVVRNCSNVREETLFGRKVIRGCIDGVDTALVIAGVGKANAAAGTQLAIGSLGATAVLNAGVAGGLEPSMQVRELYRAAKAVEYDFDLSKVNGTAVGVPDERDTPFFDLGAAGAWPKAIVATGDRFTNDESDFEFLRREFGATVRDMELGAIAHAAWRAGVTVYSLKAITNVVGRGGMTSQYAENLPVCLETLSAAVPEFFAAVG
jgi:adenosylhomocysteine nucleosidase